MAKNNIYRSKIKFTTSRRRVISSVKWLTTSEKKITRQILLCSKQLVRAALASDNLVTLCKRLKTTEGLFR